MWSSLESRSFIGALPLTSAIFIRMTLASSLRPLVKSHLGDSGTNFQQKNNNTMGSTVTNEITIHSPDSHPIKGNKQRPSVLKY